MNHAGVAEDHAGGTEEGSGGRFISISLLRSQLSDLQAASAEVAHGDMLRVVGPTRAIMLDGRGGALIVANPDRPVIVAGVLVSPALADALSIVAAAAALHGLTLDAFVAQAHELLAARGR